MNVKRWIALAVFLFMLFSLVSQSSNTWENVFDFSGDKWKIDFYRQGTGEDIALIDLFGTITAGSGDSSFLQEEAYSHNIFLDQLETAFSENTIKGVILRIDSPGGSVSAADEIFRKIKDLKEKHDKPLVVYMDGIAASGGYLVSVPADVIFANRNTLTGSIGVILTTFNVHRLADEWGVQEESFTSGEYKNMLSPFKEVRSEEREIVQELISESYDFFIDSILEFRDMEREELLKLADGRIFSGNQAYENGLIDQLGFLDDAIAKIEELTEIADANILHFKRIPPKPIDYFFGKINSLSAKSNILENFVTERRNIYPELMYIWKP